MRLFMVLRIHGDCFVWRFTARIEIYSGYLSALPNSFTWGDLKFAQIRACLQIDYPPHDFLSYCSCPGRLQVLLSQSLVCLRGVTHPVARQIHELCLSSRNSSL
jgi:hypothetical protein